MREFTVTIVIPSQTQQYQRFLGDDNGDGKLMPPLTVTVIVTLKTLRDKACDAGDDHDDKIAASTGTFLRGQSKKSHYGLYALLYGLHTLASADGAAM